SLHAAQLTPQDYPAPVDPDREMQTELTILASRAVAEPVIARLDLTARDPEIAGALAATRRQLAKKGRRLSAAGAAEEAAAVFHAQLTMAPDKLSSTVHLSFRSRDPRVAAAVVNATAQAFLAVTLAERGAQGEEAAHWMRQQVAQAAQQLADDDHAVSQFQQQHAYVPLLEPAGTGEQSALLARLSDANHALAAAQAERIGDEAALASYHGGVVAALPADLRDPAIESATARVGAAEQQLATLATTYQPGFPLVVEAQQQLTAARQQLAGLQTQVAAGLGQRLASSREREQQLSSLVEDLNHQAAATSGLEMAFGVLEARAAAQRTLVATLREKLSEVELEASLPPSNIQVLDQALTPDQPLYPRLGLDLALGLGLGLALGVGAALARERVSETLTTAADVPRVLGPALAPLGMIAELRRPARHGQALLPAAGGAGEADLSGYAKVAANLVARCGTPPRAVLLTSANPGEGKTQSVCRLAEALAAAGWRTLVVDCDLEAPGCARFFGLAEGGHSGGLQAALAGRKLTPLSLGPHLDLVPVEAGGGALPMRAMAALLEQWREHYDYVLLDSPPTSASGTAVLLSSLVEAVVLVLRWGRTRQGEAQQAAEELARAHAPLCGTLFNRADPRAPSFRPYRRTPSAAA
ncbi:MAG TPA: GNVR domain-containing protein, partial [Terriglobales bacterium]|nr:GNVR domain-containing protein [Terriglobales bacterium]